MKELTLTRANFYTASGAIDPFDLMTFSIINRGLDGATGGSALKVVIDKDTSYPFAIVG